MVPNFHYSALFMHSARQLGATDPDGWAGLLAAIKYLREFQRAAVAPHVKWHIVQSEFAAHCGEIRWPNPEEQADYPGTALRGLFVAHPSNEWYVFTVLGNKATAANAWYASAIKQSDEIAHQAIKALGLTTFPESKA